MSRRLAAEKQLRDVEHLDLFAPRRAGHAVAHHVQAKRAGRRKRLRASRDRFLRTQVGDTLLRRFIEPHPAPARAAAKRLFSAARHFPILLVLGRADYCAGRIDLAIHSRQVTRVMQRDRFAARVVRQSARVNQLCEQGRVMLHLVLPAELRVFVLEGVVTMRTRSHDLLHLAAVQRFDIGLCALLKKKLIPDPTRRITRAGLFLAQDGEIYTRFLE